METIKAFYKDEKGYYCVMNKKILKRIEEIFAEKLQQKTNWGRNEIMVVYLEAVNEALMELLDA